MRARELSSSSVIPSEKYSWLGSPLRLPNGSTAIECGGGAKAAAAGVECFEIPNLSVTKYASVAMTAASASSKALDLQAVRSGCLSPGVATDTALNADNPGDSRRCIRSTKAGGVS